MHLQDLYNSHQDDPTYVSVVPTRQAGQYQVPGGMILRLRQDAWNQPYWQQGLSHPIICRDERHEPPASNQRERCRGCRLTSPSATLRQ